MPAEREMPGLIDSLPAVRGRLQADESLARFTWFKVGGPAEVLFRPADEDDLIAFLVALPADVPVTVIGNASNLLVRDGGVRGVVIRLGKDFSQVRIDGTRVEAAAGAAGLVVARAARDAGVGGLEFLAGIPGTVGGAVRMNAGAYDRETKDVCLSARFVDRGGRIHERDAADMGFAYRHSAIDDDWIAVSAVFEGRCEDPAIVGERMADIQRQRDESQPVRTPTGGSTFRNPPGHKAWELIDRAGCRGLMRGGAQVSDLHCNFLVNTGNASAADLEGLGEEVRRRVFEKYGVTLEWEIRRIGEITDKPMREADR